MQQFEAEDGSKTVGWARYDGKTLEIDFKNYKTGAKASTYSYDGTLLKDGMNPYGVFPESDWLQFNAATKKASHFAKYIRPKFKGVKIWP